MTGSAPTGPDPGAGVVVIGGGAVGSFIAALIARSGRAVVLAGRPGSGRSGSDELAVRTPDGAAWRTRVDRADGTAGLGRPAGVVLAVKMPDLDAAIEACAAWPTTPVVTLQNGIGAEEAVAAARPGAPLLAGSLTAPLGFEADGTLAWRARRGIAFGSVRGDTAAVLAALRDPLDAAGLAVAQVDDWRAMKWSKLLTNLVANAVPALLDSDAASVYADRRLFAVERAAVLETLRVMRALGYAPMRLPGADIRWLAAAFRAPTLFGQPVLRRVVGRARGGKAPSLLLHLRAGGGPSEAPWLNGAVARAGEAAGVPTPVNAALAAMMAAAAASPAARDTTRGRPTALLSTIGGPSTTWRSP